MSGALLGALGSARGLTENAAQGDGNSTGANGASVGTTFPYGPFFASKTIFGIRLVNKRAYGINHGCCEKVITALYVRASELH